MPDSLRKAKMIRTKRYKLVYRIKERNEFYDLEKDPMEMDNRYGEPAYASVIRVHEKSYLNTS